MRSVLAVSACIAFFGCTSKPLHQVSASGGATGSAGARVTSGGVSGGGWQSIGGGALGTAGGGDAAQAGDAGSGADEAWLTADGEWEELGFPQGCRVRRALQPQRLFPGLPWVSCGSGCRATRLVRGSDESLAYDLGIAPRVSGDDRKGIATAWGPSGSFMTCEYQMSAPVRGAGNCNFSDGARYQVHVGN